jgi:hypothetical protein
LAEVLSRLRLKVKDERRRGSELKLTKYVRLREKLRG